MEDEDNRPKWLLELETRKRKPRLAHEAGAGAPCLICSSECPGLDLHFWRKICKNCKCGRNDHDFDDDEFPQFDLLFGRSGKAKKRSVFLPVRKQNQDEIPFEWVPPDTSKELATDYMKALPADKLPIEGSAGAAFRRQQLQKQLPLHDIDHKACDELSDQERKQFEEYLENLKNYVGQGKVTKVLGARPFSRALMTPANATDVQRFSPQHKAGLNISGPVRNLRTPRSFISKNASLPSSQSVFLMNEPPPFSSTQLPPLPASQPPPLPLCEPPYSRNNAIPANLESLRTQTLGNSVEISPQGRYNRALFNTPNEANLTKSGPIDALNSAKKSASFTQLLKNDTRTLASKSQNSLNQSPEESFLQNNDYDQEESNISEIEAHLEETCKIDAHLEKSIELPQDIAEKMLSEALFPPSAMNSGDIIGSTLDEKGLMYIREKLNYKYSNKSDIGHKGPFESRELEGSRRPEIANKELEIVSNTERNQFVPRGSEIMSVKNPEMAEALGHGKLQDLVSVNSRLKNPSINPQQCISTDEKLQSASNANPNRTMNSSLSYSPYAESLEPLQAELSSYGSAASNVINSELLFNPVFPEEAIGGIPINLADVVRLSEDLESKKGALTKQKCHKCQDEINSGEVVVTAEKAQNEVWHPGCFVCSVCNELLADLVYFFYKGKLYCGRDLASHLDIQRCFACDELIFTSMYTVAEGHTYHVKHFCCWDCDKPLAGQQYTSENDRPLCLPCYQRTYAKTCNACNKVIAADQQGVAIKNLDFHVDEKCFCCFNCRKSLLNGKIGIKENKPFCSKECITHCLSEKF